MIPEGLKYTKDHEWVRDEGDEVVIGITHHAQGELGDITFVDLPEQGADFKKQDALCTIESVKAASDVYAPLSGKVSAVNGSLGSEPEMINSAPYEDGWICRMAPSDKTELDDLMDAGEYQQFLEESGQ